MGKIFQVSEEHKRPLGRPASPGGCVVARGTSPVPCPAAWDPGSGPWDPPLLGAATGTLPPPAPPSSSPHRPPSHPSGCPGLSVLAAYLPGACCEPFPGIPSIYTPWERGAFDFPHFTGQGGEVLTGSTDTTGLGSCQSWDPNLALLTPSPQHLDLPKRDMRERGEVKGDPGAGGHGSGTPAVESPSRQAAGV